MFIKYLFYHTYNEIKNKGQRFLHNHRCGLNFDFPRNN